MGISTLRVAKEYMKKVEADILPLVIAILLNLYSLVITLTFNYVLRIENYVGTLCLLISCVLYFKNRNYYYGFFGLFLLLGVFGLLSFFYKSYKFGFGSFGIDPISFSLLILTIVFIFYVVDKNESK